MIGNSNIGNPMPENLVIGASGQVGEHLLTALQESGRSVLGTYHQHQTEGLVPLDLRESRQTADLIQQCAPQTIYLPGALTNVDYCETHPEDSRAINVTALQGVVHAANAIGAGVVYFSSDYIFDGRSGAYTEDQPANPICEYGRHKLAAEHYISLNAAKFLIIRTTVVFGWEAQGKNFVSRLISDARRKAENARTHRSGWQSNVCARPQQRGSRIGGARSAGGL